MNIFTPQNTLQVPEAMGSLTTVIGGIAALFIPVLFVTEIIAEQTKTITDETPEYTKVIRNTVIIILSLSILYKWIFLKIVASCEYIGMSVTSAADWSSWTEGLFKDSPTTVSITSLNIITFLSAFFSVILGVIENVFLTIRYALLCLLYAIGPLAFAAAISRTTRPMLKGWFTSLFQVSFWVVMLKVMQQALYQMNQSKLVFTEGSGDVITSVVVNGIIVSAMVLMVPTITSAVLSGQHLGMAGTAAMGALAAVGSAAGGNLAFQKMKTSAANVGIGYTDDKGRRHPGLPEKVGRAVASGASSAWNTFRRKKPVSHAPVEKEDKTR